MNLLFRAIYSKQLFSAVTDTTLITCSIQALYPHICRHSELNRLIFELLSENYTQLDNQLKRLTINDSTKRAASYLIDLTANNQEELGIVDHTLPYTQKELICVPESASHCGC